MRETVLSPERKKQTPKLEQRRLRRPWSGGEVSDEEETKKKKKGEEKKEGRQSGVPVLVSRLG